MPTLPGKGRLWAPFSQILVSYLCCFLGALIVSALAPKALQLEISLFKVEANSPSTLSIAAESLPICVGNGPENELMVSISSSSNWFLEEWPSKSVPE
ncbi:hypothetical protein MUK42_07377 [Musa troglodytarum]|uniref:Uncharacterized protein n=1 Tax=Musa troglodytarum TaxID=320322 RepID=A0A9E7HMY2_9LILI|nr:hypothetical protein MUK42_07377 [Musa troglodytarum]